MLSHRCSVCGQAGEVQLVEHLPKNGLSMKCVHPDGTVHEWAEYSSMETLMNRKKTTKKPKIIVCPKCGKRGRLNPYVKDQTKPYEIHYYVRHEKTGGYFGDKRRTAKTRRCYITEPAQRELILKKLGLLK